MDIALFGVQGSGKGTQGKIFAKKNDFVIFETGAELRRLAQEDSPLGNKIKDIIEAGHLVDDNIVMEIIENFLSEHNPDAKIIFDGIPRSMSQKDKFDVLLAGHNRDFVGLYIDISFDEALNRLTKRRICPKDKKVFLASYPGNTCDLCGTELVTRADDNEESIKTRLNAYERETMPVIEAYRAQNKMIDINGEQSVEAVANEVTEKLHDVI